MDGLPIWREDCAPACFAYLEDGSMNESWIRWVDQLNFFIIYEPVRAFRVLQNMPPFNKDEITHLQRAQDEPNRSLSSSTVLTY
ncbi:hypothetical protein PABG_12456 [Paracoccidioides brasiliensis Pb03]|nr:hypothetical protein PABG_12456 [Paracoccidioides brasiliensis Pb03]